MRGRPPDFIVPGASRSGTTSLYHYLGTHEEIFLPDRKELHFFDREMNYSQGLSAYESHFADAGDRIAGEMTPLYFQYGQVYDGSGQQSYRWDPDDDVPARIRRAYPDIKLLITLRNPVTRAHSQFWKNYRQGRERVESFEAAIREGLAGERPKETNPRCWVYRNRYPVHVGRWLDHFDRDQIKFMVFERWTEEPDRALDEICSFLGVSERGSWPGTDQRHMTGESPRFVTPNRLYQQYLGDTVVADILRKYRVTHALDALNSRAGYPDLTEEERTLLADEFRPEIDELEAMTGLNLEIWREQLPD